MSTMLSNKLCEMRPGMLAHWCPGCEERHIVYVENPQLKHKTTWNWNGSVDRPTLSPSVKHHGWKKGKEICHYFLRDGRLQFCSDSSHTLAGETVDLPDLP